MTPNSTNKTVWRKKYFTSRYQFANIGNKFFPGALITCVGHLYKELYLKLSYQTNPFLVKGVELSYLYYVFTQDSRM